MLTKNRVLAIVLSVTAAHLLLSLVVSHYAAKEIGTAIGRLAAAGLTEAVENPQIKDTEVKKVYEDMRSKVDEIALSWRTPLFLMSLPLKPLMNPIRKALLKKRMNMALSKEISMEEFRTQARLTEYTATTINSLVFGFIVYLAVSTLGLLKHNHGLQRIVAKGGHSR
jgi:hypothetical protein